MSASQMPEAGDVIAGRYKLVEPLGKGGFGVVYLAHQDRKPQQVALKVMAATSANLAIEPEEMKRRFRREAIMASNLIHPHAVRQFDFGEHGDFFYISMELVQGDTLDQRIKQQGTLSTELIARIGYATLDVLRFAHQRDIVHRDLKPENIMLCEVEGQQDFPKVLDFGAAKTMHGEHDLTMQGMTLGSPAYMSPEVLMDEAPRPASDLYSLGLTLAEAVVGHRLVSGETPVEQLKHQISPHPINVPVKLIQHPLFPWLSQAIEKDASKRYSSAQEMLTALTDLDLDGIDLSSNPHASTEDEAPKTVPMTAVPSAEEMAAQQSGDSTGAAPQKEDDPTELIDLPGELPDDLSLDDLLQDKHSRGGESAPGAQKAQSSDGPEPTEMIDLAEEQPDDGPEPTEMFDLSQEQPDDGPEPTEMFDLSQEQHDDDPEPTEMFDPSADRGDRRSSSSNRPQHSTSQPPNEDPPTEMLDYNPDRRRSVHRAVDRSSPPPKQSGTPDGDSFHQAPTAALQSVGTGAQTKDSSSPPQRQSQQRTNQRRRSQQSPSKQSRQAKSPHPPKQRDQSSSQKRHDYAAFGSRQSTNKDRRDTETQITELEPTLENDFMLVKTSHERNRSTFVPALIIGTVLMIIATFLIYIAAG